MTEDLSAADRYPVSFAIFALARAHRSLAASLLREIGLHTGQEIMLMQLWERDGQSQQELGAMLGHDHSTVAKSVRRLADAGLVSRARSTTDGRVTVVSLTDAGRALEARVEEIWGELEQVSTAGTTPQQQETFVELARSIERGLRRSG